MAKDSSYFFRHHVLVWGNQQPRWLPALDSATQRAEFLELLDTVAARYPDIDQVPLHDPPWGDWPGNVNTDDYGGYYEMLGGAGSTGWDWIIEAFRLARAAFGPDVSLSINEYSVMNETSNADNYREIIDLLVAEDTLIDAVGLQAHGFSHGASNATILRNLDTLAAAGLPLYVTEFDADGQTDRIHVRNYMRVFPLLWEHPAVKGITLWGFRPGMWRTEQGAYLIDAYGNERPAMTWLRAYLKGVFVTNESLTISTESGENTITTPGGTQQMVAEFLPENTTLTTAYWLVDNSSVATIDQDGLLTAVANGTVTVTATSLEYESDVEDTMEITITGQPTSVENISGIENLLLYPNPVIEGYFMIEGVENIKEVAVFDLNGTAVTSLDTENMSSVRIQLDVPEGMYFLRLSDGVQFYHTKIIVK